MTVLDTTSRSRGESPFPLSPEARSTWSSQKKKKESSVSSGERRLTAVLGFTSLTFAQFTRPICVTGIDVIEPWSAADLVNLVLGGLICSAHVQKQGVAATSSNVYNNSDL